MGNFWFSKCSYLVSFCERLLLPKELYKEAYIFGYKALLLDRSFSIHTKRESFSLYQLPPNLSTIKPELNNRYKHVHKSLKFPNSTLNIVPCSMKNNLISETTYACTLRYCWQITFVSFSGFCLLGKLPPPPPCS